MSTPSYLLSGEGRRVVHGTRTGNASPHVDRMPCADDDVTGPLSGGLLDCYMNASMNDRRPPMHLSQRLRHMAVPPLPPRWHLETQQRLFAQLSDFWGSSTPRVMLDLGCQAGHGVHNNLSDTLLFLDFFHAPGSLVVGVDVVSLRRSLTPTPSSITRRSPNPFHSSRWRTLRSTCNTASSTCRHTR